MSLTVDVRLQAGAFSLDATFSSDAGSTAILGASGAGKTLTLRAIAGLEAPADGEVTLDETTLYSSSKGVNLPTRRRNVGYLFQDYALFPHLSVAENIAFGMAGRSKDEKRGAVVAMVNLLSLHGLEGRSSSRLSGGERQRVALGRALAPHPDLLLLDEPFSALDAPTRESLVEEFIALRAAINVPMVLVTHDVGEAYALADYLVVMRGGRVLQSGPKADVFHRPISPNVARLVGVQNIFGDVRGGQPVVIGVRSGDIVVSPEGDHNATLNQVVDRGTQLLGRFTTSAGAQIVADLERGHFENIALGGTWHVEAREGATMVWPGPPPASLSA